jgi:hypothetical protein
MNTNLTSPAVWPNAEAVKQSLAVIRQMAADRMQSTESVTDFVLMDSAIWKHHLQPLPASVLDRLIAVFQKPQPVGVFGVVILPQRDFFAVEFYRCGTMGWIVVFQHQKHPAKLLRRWRCHLVTAPAQNISIVGGVPDTFKFFNHKLGKAEKVALIEKQSRQLRRAQSVDFAAFQYFAEHSDYQAAADRADCARDNQGHEIFHATDTDSLATAILDKKFPGRKFQTPPEAA